MQSLIDIKNVYKSYRTDFWTKPVLALNDVSFSLEEGKITGFLGANGAGKTTLIKILLGFTKADRGKIHFNPKLGRKLSEVRGNLGFFPERPYFYPHLDGFSFLNYLGKLSGIPGDKREKEIFKWAGRLNLEKALNRKIRGYSKGMLQRLGFISAVIHNPSILILDEPLSGLDPIGRKEFKEILREINKEGKTVFLSSHIVSDIEEVCHQVIFLNGGTVGFKGSLEELMSNQEENNVELRFKKSGKLEMTDFELVDSGRLPNGDFYIKVNKVKLNEAIQFLMAKEAEIVSINSFRPKLEEIIFKLGK